MRKHSVALIQHYYGKLPNYFPLWLKSVGHNRNFDFMIFTDIDFSEYNVPENVHVIPMTFDEMKARIARHIDYDFICDTPYKACDYILLYGLIFRDYLEDYEFWGHCDPDVIWGDMSKFITPEIMDKYGRIYRLGHLQMFRNTEKVRTFALQKLPDWGLTCRDIFTAPEHMAFEEYVMTEKLFDEFVGEEQYDSLDFADVSPCYRQFVLARLFRQVNETVPAFRWKDGKVYGLSVNGEMGNDIEYLYLHLQKRKMQFTPGLENEDSFMVIPNEFVKDHALTEDEARQCMLPDSSYEKANSQGIMYLIKKLFRMDMKSNLVKLYPYFQLLKGKRLVSKWGINAKGNWRLYN